MVLVAKTGQYPEGLQGFGHVPGVRGGAIGTGLKIASRLTYRGTKWLGSRFFKPKKYTYRGAVGRGIGAGTVIASLLPSPEIDDLDAPFPTGNGKTPNRFQQRNRRFRKSPGNRRCDNRYRHRNCC